MNWRRSWCGVAAAVLATLMVAGAGLQAAPLTIVVRDADNNPIEDFRWLVEEDTTIPVTPGVQDAASLGVNIHGSYAPVVAKGTATAGTPAVADVDPTKRYAVSVLPTAGYTLGGANVKAGQAEVTVLVHRLPIPAAQISVYVFEDDRPLNNAPDIPAESGLAGFKVTIHDAGGHQMMDAYGNPLGTTYIQNPDGTPLLDDEGNPVVALMGTGIIKTDANGEAVVKNLAPGKYGVIVVPPPDQPDWVQTSTIEGTPTIDAWVKAGEPARWSEWGFFSWHVWFGFVRPKTLEPSPEGTGTITGQAVYVHSNKPPLPPGLNAGRPVENAWVALNNLNANDELIYAQPCDAEGNFVIENVPPGMYQLAIWDVALDGIIDFRTVTVPPPGGVVAMGETPIYAWFGNLEGTVFVDLNANGFWDAGEPPASNQAVNIRFPDGSIYQATASDTLGEYGFNEVFPFFFYLVPEVDFARYGAVSARIVVDDGGPLLPGAKNNPQPQPENGGLPYRVELGPTLTQAMLLYADQTNEIHWGKRAYGPGENGGISGIVQYATTRAENDPRLAAAEDWEPGVPRVQVNLYLDVNYDGVIDDLDGSGGPTLADVDNAPFGWRDGGMRGDEDVDRNGNGLFDPGDAIQITTADCWDDNLPDGVGPPQYVKVGGVDVPIRSGAETLRTWNQVRPGVFDGGYAFDSYVPGGLASGNPEVEGLPSSTYYIVEAVAPPGYEHVKEEDKNVDFGDQYIPTDMTAPSADPVAFPPVPGPAPTMPAPPTVLPPVQYGPALCVGDLHLVPSELTLFPGVPCEYAGQWRRLPDRKVVYLRDGLNAAANFFLFTEVPKAGRIWGVVFNDALLEFNPGSVNKGTNLAPAWIPIAFRDFSGHEVARVYTDEWGRFNALLPSTYTMNMPAPSGVSPNMLVAVINDPGPVPDPNNPGQTIEDPWYDPGYNQLRWTFNLTPGQTTRLDTPLLPIAAFRGNRTPLDTEYPDHTPLIKEVAGGPYVPAADTPITITARGDTTVRNPDYDPDIPGSQPTIVRDYGFGLLKGTVTIGGEPLKDVVWTATTIKGTVPKGAKTGQLMVTRGDNGVTSPIGVTLHVGPSNANFVTRVSPGQSIQAAIDGAKNGQLILVEPGIYKENVILYKPVKLQGYGPFSGTIIQAGPMTPQEETAWNAKLQSLIDANQVALVAQERPDFFLETAPGILVMAKPGTFDKDKNAWVDGLKIRGALRGGAIFANAYARFLEISNTWLISNQGSFGGGIRLGTPSLVDDETTASFIGSQNDHVSIHHNLVSQNGSVDGGGGIAVFNGSDAYSITDNTIIGNFTLLYGGGIAHFGLSPDGVIARNKIVSNESFDEGGGVMIAGELVPAGAPVGTLTEGAGNVTVNANLIQGNKAGDDGGGIRALMVNGQDVQAFPKKPDKWHTVKILNNLVVNNSSADAGGGISLDDAARVFIINNTIALNDSTATGVDAFGGPLPIDTPGMWLPPEYGEAGFGALTTSVPMVAGLAARAHSTGLQAAFAPEVAQEFANPVLEDNIIWRNRSFYWDGTYGDFGGIRPDVAMGGAEATVYWDMAVYGTDAAQALSPRNCILTTEATDVQAGAYDETINTLVSAAGTLFASQYENLYQATSSGAAFGNFISTTFTPTGAVGNYHLGAGSAAIDGGAGNYLGTFPELGTDYDGEPRPQGGAPDAGADEAQ